VSTRPKLQPTTERRCETRWFSGRNPCHAEAAGKYRRSCKHGHCREGFMCAEHAKPPATAWCRPCRDEDGHLCELDIERIGDPS
jgi:hypothetical protein